MQGSTGTTMKQGAGIVECSCRALYFQGVSLCLEHGSLTFSDLTFECTVITPHLDERQRYL
jgi:hypothetical protein